MELLIDPTHLYHKARNSRNFKFLDNQVFINLKRTCDIKQFKDLISIATLTAPLTKAHTIHLSTLSDRQAGMTRETHY